MSTTFSSNDYSSREYYLADKGQTCLVHLKNNLPQVAPNVATDVVVGKVILDTVKHLGKTPSSTVEIQIESIDPKTNCITYQLIEGTSKKSTHQMVVKTENTNTIIDQITKHGIRSVDPKRDLKTVSEVLDKFSSTNKKSVKESLLHFIDSIMESFALTATIWESLTQRKITKLTKGKLILSEVAEVSGAESLSMKKSLKQMQRGLKAENQPSAAILKRINGAITISNGIEKQRLAYSENRTKRMTNSISKALDSLQENEKMLLPIGYMEKDGPVEMLAEVKKMANDKCTLTLISSSSASRKLFDRAMGLTDGSQSPQRIISNVNIHELKGAMPTLLGVQASSARGGQNTFMQALRFKNSTVEVGVLNEKVGAKESRGHLHELISYFKLEKLTPEEQTKFELALRLRFFLDVCKNNKAALKDPKFWTLARTCALELASCVEREKKMLGKTQVQQGIELGSIYNKLVDILDLLQKNPPPTVDITKEKLPLITAPTTTKTLPYFPEFFDTLPKMNALPNIDPPFSGFDAKNPLASIENGSLRISKLLDLGEVDTALREAKMLTRMLPKASNAFWTNLQADDAEKIEQALAPLGEAIARASIAKSPASLHDLLSLTALNYFGYMAACKISPSEATKLRSFLYVANTIGNDLMQSRLPITDKRWLLELMQKNPCNTANAFTDCSESLLNLNQHLAIVAGEKEGLTADSLSKVKRFQFTEQRPGFGITMEGNYLWRRDSVTEMPKNYRRAYLSNPEYAEAISTEIQNRYTTEYCCLGCIRDNCPSYNATPHNEMRYHPLYMAHNFVHDFCPTLTTKGTLHRDEVVQLLYTQQTNTNARTLFVQNREQDNFRYATLFTDTDRQSQMMNTIELFLENPHFFKQPELRWHFETKLFNHQAFGKLVSRDSYNDYRPFLESTLKKINETINIAYASGNLEVAGYLLYIADEIQDVIENSELRDGEKAFLTSLLSADTKKQLIEWSTSIAKGTDSRSVEKQKMVMSLLLNKYYKEICRKGSDEILTDQQSLSLLLVCLCRLEGLDYHKEQMDPEVKERYQALLTLITPHIKNLVQEEKSNKSEGAFINRVLLILNPSIAQEGLAWNADSFPTFVAKKLVNNEEVEYRFDIFTGSLTLGNHLAQAIPSDVRKDPALQQLFGESLKEVWKIKSAKDDAVTSYTNKKFPGMRIVVDRRNKGMPAAITVERALYDAKGQKTRIHLTQFDALKSLQQGQKVGVDSDLPPTVASLIGNRQCWIDRANSTVYVYDTVHTTPYATIKLSSVKDDRGLKATTYLTDCHIHATNTHVLAANTKQLNNFTAIEDPNFILVTGKESQAQRIEYTRLALASNGSMLVFEQSNKGITTPSMPGYALAAKGKRPGLANTTINAQPLPLFFDNFSLLEKDGSQQVLIPMRKFSQRYDSAGSPLPLVDIHYPDNLEKCPVFEYSLDSETNRLVAKSSDGYAYLAYIAAIHNDFAASSYYLAKARTSIDYSENYTPILQWMRGLKNESPNAIAMQLKFELFHEQVLRDKGIHLLFQGKKDEALSLDNQRGASLEHVAKLYDHYVKLKAAKSLPGYEGIDPSLELSCAEEKRLLQLLELLVQTRGDEVIDAESADFVRAKASIPQKFTKDIASFFNISTGAFALWTYKGNSSVSSQNMENPLWIVNSFRSLFNSILEAEKGSNDLVRLEKQIKCTTLLPLNKLSKHEKEAVYLAQAYLLKLINAKNENSDRYRKLIGDKENKLFGKLGDAHKLAAFQGSLFVYKRQEALEKFSNTLQAVYGTTPLENIETVKNKASEFYEKSVDPFAPEDNSKETQSNRQFALDTLSFIDQYLAQKEKIQKLGQQPRHFAEVYKEFVLQRFFGKDGLESILTLHNLFKTLNKATIAEDGEKLASMQQPPATPQETFKQKYQPLLDQHKALLANSEIQTLEKAIFSRQPKTQNAQSVSKPKDVFVYVIPEHLRTTSVSCFNVSQKPQQPISEAIFDQVAKSDEPAVKRLAEEHRQDLRAFQAERKNVTLTRQDAEKLLSEVKIAHSATKKNKDTLAKEIQQFVASTNVDPGVKATRQLIGASIPVSFDRLLALWWTKDLTKPWDENPLKALGVQPLSKAELKALDTKIKEYLVCLTEGQHLSRLTEALNAHIASCAQAVDATGDNQLAQAAYELVNTQRQYFLNENLAPDMRDFLYIEAKRDVIMRNSQIKTLEIMFEDANAVEQLGMGEGKSKFLVAMLAKKKADGTNLVMVLNPEELEETNCRDLDATNRDIYGRQMYRFTFTRTSDRSVEGLNKVYEMLLRTIDDRGYVMSTKRSMLGFNNAYFETFVKIKEATEKGLEATNLINEFRAMSKIMALFHDRTDVIADEIDSLLDIRKEVNFSLSNSLAIDPFMVSVGTKMMQIILRSKAADPLHALTQALIDNQQATIPAEKRKEHLASIIKIFLSDHKPMLDRVEISVPFTTDEFVAYAFDDTQDTKIEKWLNELKKALDKTHGTVSPSKTLEDDPYYLYKALTSLKGFVTKGFNTTFGRKDNVNYGRDPVTGSATIPYMASNKPRTGSEFDDTIECISFTLQDYVQTGVTYRQVYDSVVRMHNEAVKELQGAQSGQILNINNTKAGKHFKEFIEQIATGNPLLSGLTLDLFDTEEAIKALQAAINRTPNGRLSFCLNEALANTTKFSSQINSVSGDLTGMVRNFGGFSGTPWNRKGYDDKIHAHTTAGTDGKSWAILLGRQIDIQTFTYDPVDPVGSLLSGTTLLGSCQALIDTGAYLCGIDNNQFIDAALLAAQKKGIGIQAGIYFDNSGTIVKKVGADGAPIALGVAKATDPMHTLTLYDQAHTVGADIKQGRKANAVVTIGENTYIRDLFQAIWRLRQLDKEQTVTFAISEQVKELILKGAKRPLTIDDILKFCLENEAKREAEDNFRSEKGKINGTCKRECSQAIADLVTKGLSNEELKKLAVELAPIYVKERLRDEAFVQFSKLKKAVEPAEILSDLKMRAKDQCEKAAEAFKEVSPAKAQGLKTKANDVATRANKPLDWFPKQTSTAQDDSGNEVDVEAQTLAELEMELMLETQTTAEVNLIIENVIPQVQGAGASGDVHPLTANAIGELFQQGGNYNPDYLRNISRAIPLFDPELYCSAVFERSMGPISSPDEIFYSNRKFVTELVIAKSSTGMKLIIPTIHEARAACKEFCHNAPTDVHVAQVAISSGRALMVYNNNGDRSDRIPFDGQDLKQFYRLYVQAKLFNGEIQFHTTEEKEALKEWLQEKGVQQVQSYFENYILAAKPRRFADGYKTSSLKEIFNELAGAKK